MIKLTARKADEVSKIKQHTTQIHRQIVMITEKKLLAATFGVSVLFPITSTTEGDEKVHRD
jgi:hypothetical protein